MAAEVHVGDVGTIFEVTLTDENNAIVDISGASIKTLYFKKPGGTVLTKVATLTNTGTDGKMRYVAVAGDLDTAGVWEVQGYVELSAGKWYAARTSFAVVGNLV